MGLKALCTVINLARCSHASTLNIASTVHLQVRDASYMLQYTIQIQIIMCRISDLSLSIMILSVRCIRFTKLLYRYTYCVTTSGLQLRKGFTFVRLAILAILRTGKLAINKILFDDIFISVILRTCFQTFRANLIHRHTDN